MKENIKELNEYVDILKNDCEIDCIEHIKKKYNIYVWCLNLINKAIDSDDIIDHELKNSIIILQQIIKEAQNNISYSKTGFCAHEGQDREHTRSIRYLIVSKIKEIYCKDKNNNLLTFPINDNADIDLDNVKLFHEEHIISFETYLSYNEERIIKLAILDENISDFKKLKQYDFVVNTNKIEKVYYKKTTGIITENYYPFQYYGLKNINTIEKFINCENE